MPLNKKVGKMGKMMSTKSIKEISETNEKSSCADKSLRNASSVGSASNSDSNSSSSVNLTEESKTRKIRGTNETLESYHVKRDPMNQKLIGAVKLQKLILEGIECDETLSELLHVEGISFLAYSQDDPTMKYKEQIMEFMKYGPEKRDRVTRDFSQQLAVHEGIERKSLDSFLSVGKHLRLKKQ
jgi:hypothetical protein